MGVRTIDKQNGKWGLKSGIFLFQNFPTEKFWFWWWSDYLDELDAFFHAIATNFTDAHNIVAHTHGNLDTLGGSRKPFFNPAKLA